ncbi:MAG: ACT domain-containing protein [Geobacter sp.]|nr:ACT domain-containing protein [Geobacter sp.]
MDEPKSDTAYFAVSVIGKDRPGIVAGAAEVLYRLGCNIEDSSCTMLAGEFAMILIVTHEKPFSKAHLVEEFVAYSKGMELSVFVRGLKRDEVEYHSPQGELCVITVYGADRPGIVYRVTRELADRSINITDLNTKLIGTSAAPVYILVIEAELTEGTSSEDVERLLHTIKEELAVEITVRIVTPVAL